jgi:hypothetical protein
MAVEIQESRQAKARQDVRMVFPRLVFLDFFRTRCCGIDIFPQS